MDTFVGPIGTRFTYGDSDDVVTVRRSEVSSVNAPIADLLAFAAHIESAQLASNPSLRKAVLSEDLHIVDQDYERKEFIRRAAVAMHARQQIGDKSIRAAIGEAQTMWLMLREKGL